MGRYGGFPPGDLKAKDPTRFQTFSEFLNHSWPKKKIC